MTMAKSINIDEAIDYKKAIDMFANGVEAVKQRGKADVGEKTMMDVLIPVANCLKQGIENDKDLREINIWLDYYINHNYFNRLFKNFG